MNGLGTLMKLTNILLCSPVGVVPDIIAAVLFASKQYQRKKLNAATLQAMQNVIKNSKEEASRATVAEFFQGFWDMMVEILEVTSVFPMKKSYYYHNSKRSISTLRQSSYEMILIATYSLAYIVPFLIRVNTNAYLSPDNSCTGCIVQWQDIIIVNSQAVVISVSLATVYYRVGKYDIPDPLMYIDDLKKL
jgi:hypothetical protein